MSLLEAKINTKELQKIQNNILCKSKEPQKVSIIAVTKTFSFTAIQSAYSNKIYNIGENKIQELEKKTHNKKIPNNLRIHFIGHLQRNKAKKAIELCDYIQSVDSIKLAKEINKLTEKIKKKQKIYLQINIGRDEKKHGFDIKDLAAVSKEILNLKNLSVVGIMTILPNNIKTKEARKLYRKIEKIKNEINKKYFTECKELSMGMSKDYKIALACGATQIRIGTRLYGKRK